MVKKTEIFGLVPIKLRKTLDLNILRLRKAVKGAVEHSTKLPDLTLKQKICNLKQDLYIAHAMFLESTKYVNHIL